MRGKREYNGRVNKSLRFLLLCMGLWLGAVGPLCAGPVGWSVAYRRLGVLTPASAQLPLISPGGAHYVTLLANRQPAASTWQVVVDGQPWATYAQPVLFPKYPFSADGRHLAYLAFDAAGACVVADGQVGPPLPGVIPQSIRFSADGRHLAYLAETPDGWCAVVDGRREAAHPWLRAFIQPLGPWACPALLAGGNDGTFWSLGDAMDFMSDPSECLLFSPDGTRVAYAADNADDTGVLAVDGRETLPGGLAVLLRFSPDSRHLTCWAHDVDRWTATRDGAELLRADGLYAPTVTPDGAHFAYIARRAGKWWVGIEATPEGGYALPEGPSDDGDPHIPLVISRDGKHTACALGRDGAHRVVLDGTPTRPYQEIHGLTFSADNRLAYAIDNHAIVLDGHIGIAFEKVTDPVFSPDGRHLAYAGKKHGRWYVVLDGVPGKSYDHVLALPNQSAYACCLRFSPDGSLAYVAQHGDRWCVVTDGKEGPWFAAIDGDSLTFSADGRHLAYIAANEHGKLVVMDGVPGKPAPAVGAPALSADGRHWGYLARADAWSWRAVIDGVDGPPFRAVLGWNDNGTHIDTPFTLPDHWLTFDTPNHYHYLACTPTELLRVDGEYK